jgi:AcrR family transcriptional regulator
MTTTAVENPDGATPARERILSAAYDLFSQRGIQAVGIDAIVERSGVARQTLYRQFGSKQDLVLAFLERRETVWTKGWLQGQVERRTSNPAARLMAIFDVFDEWFHSPGFEGCSFINVMLEHGEGSDPIRQASTAYLTGIREFLEDLARGAEVDDPDDFARKWHILMKGSIVAAGEGDAEAARRAQQVAGLLLRESTASR